MGDKRLRDLLSRVLKVEAGCIGEAASPKDIPQWDSVAHLNLMLEIEAEFQVRFSAEEIPALTSFHRIREALRQKGAF